MKRACVIGWPVEHSRSPLIHRYWLKLHGLEGAYEKEAVPPAEIDAFLRSLGERAGLRVPPFDRDADYRSYVEGRPRLEGVQTFLHSRGIRLPLGEPDDPADLATVHGLARRKSEALVRRLDRQGVTASPGARRYLEAAGRMGLGRAVLSASVRAASMLNQAGLAYLAEETVDADRILAEGLRSPPAPDGLLSVCRRLGVDPGQAVAFTGTPLGVAAGRAAGIVTVGVGDETRASGLSGAGATRVVASLTALLDVRLTTGLA